MASYMCLTSCVIQLRAITCRCSACYIYEALQYKLKLNEVSSHLGKLDHLESKPMEEDVC